MFKMQYWRNYPRSLQMVLLFLMMYTFFQFTSFLWGLALHQGFGWSSELLEDRDLSPMALFLRLCLTASQTFGFFLLPAIVFSYFTHPRPFRYLGLRQKVQPLHIGLVFWITLGFIPVIQTLGGWFRQFDFGPRFTEQLEAREALLQQFMTLESYGGVGWVLFTLALLPALGEEMIFRGIIMRSLHARTGHTGVSVAISALLFAFFHFDPYGLIAIFAAGVVLGWIYHITGSLWMSIWAHFLNNAIQIGLLYWAEKNPEWSAYIEKGDFPLMIPILGLLIFISGIYILLRRQRPLPEEWSNDFSEEEGREKGRGDSQEDSRSL